jgi:hypothetical protein
LNQCARRWARWVSNLRPLACEALRGENRTPRGARTRVLGALGRLGLSRPVSQGADNQRDVPDPLEELLVAAATQGGTSHLLTVAAAGPTFVNLVSGRPAVARPPKGRSRGVRTSRWPCDVLAVGDG